MDYLQNILENANTPVISAIILGLMTAISPCPLATNITAIAYLSKNIKGKKHILINGLLYTLGRITTYTVIGLVLFFGASRFSVAKILQSNGEKYIGPLLIIIGVFMLDLIKINFGSGNKINELIAKISHKSSFVASFMMGVLFALAFCPYSGVLYFGMLIPLTVSSASGLYLPSLFAIATALPVIIFAFIISYAIGNIGKMYNKILVFEKYFKKIVAVVFIMVGLYYVYMVYISKFVG